MWDNPKINWESTDKINASDFNRIKNNMIYLIDLAKEIYPDFETVELAEDQGYTDLPFASLWNAVEQDLFQLYRHTYQFDGNKELVRWYPNNRYIDWSNLNRIESLQLGMFEYLTGQKSGLIRLSFRLGQKPLGIRR